MSWTSRPYGAAVVDVLNRHPEDNVSLLERASRTDDTEVSHCATTAMTGIQSGYEARIADLESAYKEQKGNSDILRSLRNELMHYIDSGRSSSGRFFILMKRSWTGS